MHLWGNIPDPNDSNREEDINSSMKYSGGHHHQQKRIGVMEYLRRMPGRVTERTRERFIPAEIRNDMLVIFLHLIFIGRFIVREEKAYFWTDTEMELSRRG